MKQALWILPLIVAIGFTFFFIANPSSRPAYRVERFERSDGALGRPIKGRGGRGERGEGGIKVLVMDLDETMVHTMESGVTIERPHLYEFLEFARDNVGEIAVFTAGTRDYAKPVLDRIERKWSSVAGSKRSFGRRYYRDSCSVVDNFVVKDLDILGEEDTERDVRIVDNTPSVYRMHPGCGIPVHSFFGDPEDAHLPTLYPVIKRR
jgi:hypothetical protein